jgi:hypothetical protein
MNNQTPGSMLELYMHAMENGTTDDFLDAVNLGIGNYTDAEYWQQMEAFKNGMFADSSMTQKVVERAKLETQRRIVDAVVEGRDGARVLRQIDYEEPPDYGPGGPDVSDRREYFDKHIRNIWEGLGYVTEDGEQISKQAHQAWLIKTVTGLDENWVPPHWRMLMARHEGSRSKEARLIDNIFGRPPEPDAQPVEDFPA